MSETKPPNRVSREELAIVRSGALYALGAGIVIVLALALWVTHAALLLVFAGILLAVLLHGLSAQIEHRAGLPRMVALPLIILFIALLIGIMVLQAGPTIEQQFQQLLRALQTAFSNVTQAARNAADKPMFREFDPQELLNLLPSPWGVASGATAAITAILGGLASAVIVIFVGIYLAADPAPYIRLAVRLAPSGRADAFRDLMVETGGALRGWLIGQFCSMAAIGLLVYVGLLFLGVPLAFVLALFAALMGFIPYLGPILGAIPMLAVAAGQGVDQFLWVFGLYVAVQAVESYLLTPLIQARAVHMPPAIVIASQLIMGALFGIVGLALATPLVAAMLVPLAHLYPKRDVDVPE